MQRRSIAPFVAALAVVGGLALAGCGNNGNESTPAPTVTTTITRAQPGSKTPQGQSPQGGQTSPLQGERRDLVTFRIDDRSTSGITDIWVVWTITNHSSGKSDYTWDWEAVTPDGTRVADGTEYVNNVQPGQTTRGEDVTTLESANVKLNITSFDRTKAF